ncbi:MAG: DUF1330 domain-containing protein [Alteromonadaceae bacterium]|nr:DUF1330 domain-containing protein [Alteromonadaceae bacterium]
MKPILSTFGGGFGCYFKVSEVLLPEENREINRVFTIYFQDVIAKDEFFSNTEYLKVKALYFNDSVGFTTLFSSYEANR